MAEFLVKAIDTTHSNPIINEQGCFKKGDIVQVQPNNHQWGEAEGLPSFVIVKVPELDHNLVLNRMNKWEKTVSVNVIQSDPVLDAARVSVSVDLPGASNKYAITLEQIQTWLKKWGATIYSAAENEIIFDIKVKDAYMSEGFWNRNPAAYNISITEIDYDQETYTHTAEIDVFSSQVYFGEIERIVSVKGGTVVNIYDDLITVKFTRYEIRTAFAEDLRNLMKGIIRRRRYKFTEEDVDTAVGMGGVVELTTEQLATHLIDKANES